MDNARASQERLPAEPPSAEIQATVAVLINEDGWLPLKDGESAIAELVGKVLSARSRASVNAPAGQAAPSDHANARLVREFVELLDGDGVTDEWPDLRALVDRAKGQGQRPTRRHRNDSEESTNGR